MLCNSNTKWLSLGIEPESRIMGPNANGFHADFWIGGSKMASFKLGGCDGFLGLCKTFRMLDMFKYKSPAAKYDYDEIDTEVLYNVYEKNGTTGTWYIVENTNGETFNIGYKSVCEMLKYESIYVAGYRSVVNKCAAIETQFNDLISKGVNDLVALTKSFTDNPDLMDLDMYINQIDVFKNCIEKVTQNPGVLGYVNTTINVNAATPSKKKKAKHCHWCKKNYYSQKSSNSRH